MGNEELISNAFDKSEDATNTLNKYFEVYSKKEDMVNEPPHYTFGGIECIDAIESATKGLDGIESFCTGNAMKYIWRWKHKNGVEDIKKAIWYLNRLISTLESQGTSEA